MALIFAVSVAMTVFAVVFYRASSSASECWSCMASMTGLLAPLWPTWRSLRSFDQRVFVAPLLEANQRIRKSISAYPGIAFTHPLLLKRKFWIRPVLQTFGQLMAMPVFVRAQFWLAIWSGLCVMDDDDRLRFRWGGNKTESEPQNG